VKRPEDWRWSSYSNFALDREEKCEDHGSHTCRLTLDLTGPMLLR